MEDLESIEDVEKRATCEQRALNFAKHLLKERSQYSDIGQVISAIQSTH